MSRTRSGLFTRDQGGHRRWYARLHGVRIALCLPGSKRAVTDEVTAQALYGQLVTARRNDSSTPQYDLRGVPVGRRGGARRGGPESRGCLAQEADGQEEGSALAGAPRRRPPARSGAAVRVRATQGGPAADAVPLPA